MRYYGGGIGHLHNTLPQQVNSTSDEMDVEDAGNDARDGPQDATVNVGELEVDETEEEARSGDNNDDEDDSDNYDYRDNDEGGDEDEGDDDDDDICGSDNDEGDDLGYASP